VRTRSWILIPILVAGCGSHAEHAAKQGSPKREQGASTVAHARAHAKSRPHVVRMKAAKPPPVAQQRPRAKPARKPHAKKSKPRQQHHRALPWQPDGMSQVAHVRVRRIFVYRSPRAKRPALWLSKHDENGTARTFLVRATWHDWVRVYLPTRPNGSLGWVHRRAVRMYSNGYRLIVRLRSHKLHLWRGSRLLATYPVAVGTRSTPTPRGLYYVVELLKPLSPHGSYGPFSFGLSAHSQVLKEFSGGDGRVGLHGTNQPDLIGSNVSHGCIRLRNPAVRRLARVLPLGTPVYIRA
jgi:lipoprotein-anchoring transpeptidase ErfK/SrfK